jgi:hypothetical protein
MRRQILARAAFANVVERKMPSRVILCFARKDPDTHKVDRAADGANDGKSVIGLLESLRGNVSVGFH